MRLLKIRQIQLKRELTDTGPGMLLILAVLIVLVYRVYMYYQETPEAYYLTGALFFICLMIQFSRKDKFFVYNHVDHPHQEMFYEYLVLTFPFGAPALLTSNWFCYPLLIVALIVVSFLKYSLEKRNYFKNISKIIHPADFELISGFRKTFIYLIPIYIGAIVFCWFRLLPLFLLWFITVIIASFYNECEPLQILKEGGESSRKFLQQKILRHSKYILLLDTLIVLINTVFNPEFLDINLLFIPTQLALLSFAICLKYSNYQPNKNSVINSIILSLVSMCTFIPYLIPIPLLMAYTYYVKAANNLDNYFHD
jgi:hypothetical protein